MNSAIQSPGKKYQRFVSLCLHEARATTDFKLKSFLVEMAQTWQRLADEAKAQRVLPKTPNSEPDRGD
jgi:hypothetical protein